MSQHLRSTLIAIAETEQQEFSLKQQLRRFEQEIADVNELVAPVEMVLQNLQAEKTMLIKQHQQMEKELEPQRIKIEKLEKNCSPPPGGQYHFTGGIFFMFCRLC